jgi:hypothetical protein
MRRLLLQALLFAPLAVATGCGGSGNNVWVTGKLLKAGAKYEPPKDHQVNVYFVALEAKDAAGKAIQGGEPFQADYDPTSGSFSVPGVEGRGIPPGKYRVAVTEKLKREAYDALPAPLKKKGAISRDDDMLKSQYGIGTSPIIREIPKSTDLDIDMTKPTGG